MIRSILNRPFFIRLLHWEYWSFNAVYGPIYIVWMLLCVRTGRFFFFNTSNPSIKNGGFLLESKKEIYELLPEGTYPKTLFFPKDTAGDAVIKEVLGAGLVFPIIAKPDIGMQGIAVKKVASAEELAEYAAKTKVDFLVQDFVPYEEELGIFYYRFPNEEKGHISGIVGKEFLGVTGDGILTIEALLRKQQRFILQLPALEKMYGDGLQRVLAKGEHFLMVPYGNHARGAKFIDCSVFADDALIAAIDQICRKIPGFYFGRMDIRYNSLDELRAGKNFSIIELNGAGSEPTHMYDPKHSLFFAWKEIIRHWILLNRISRMNHRIHNLPYMTFSEGMAMLRENKSYVKLIRNVH